MSRVIKVASKEDFLSAIRGNKVVVVDFYAEWCGPCQMMSTKVDEWSKTYSEITFLKVDVDELSDLAEEYDVSAMPTFKIFKDGKVANTIVGANVPSLLSAIEKASA